MRHVHVTFNDRTRRPREYGPSTQGLRFGFDLPNVPDLAARAATRIAKVNKGADAYPTLRGWAIRRRGDLLAQVEIVEEN